MGRVSMCNLSSDIATRSSTFQSVFFQTQSEDGSATYLSTPYFLEYRPVTSELVLERVYPFLNCFSARPLHRMITLEVSRRWRNQSLDGEVESASNR